MPKVTRQSPKPPVDNGAAVDVFDGAVPLDKLPLSGLKFLIFGMSGTGKTTLACDFPKPLLLVRPEQLEDGSRSVRAVKGVNATPFLTDPDQLTVVAEGQLRTRRYRTIVVDGLEDVQNLVIRKHMGFQDIPAQLMWSSVPQADWGVIALILKTVMRDLIRCSEGTGGCNVVLVCGEKKFGDKGDGGEVVIGIPKVMADLTPKITGFFHKVCDYTIHTFKRPGVEQKEAEIAGVKVAQEVPTGRSEYCLHVDDPDCYYATKWRGSRGTKLPPIIVDPTFAKLAALIPGGKLEKKGAGNGP